MFGSGWFGPGWFGPGWFGREAELESASHRRGKPNIQVRGLKDESVLEQANDDAQIIDLALLFLNRISHE